MMTGRIRAMKPCRSCKCRTCYGTGKIKDGSQCPLCQGTGRVVKKYMTK